MKLCHLLCFFFAWLQGGLTATDVFAVEWIQTGLVHYGTTVSYFGFIGDGKYHTCNVFGVVNLVFLKVKHHFSLNCFFYQVTVICSINPFLKFTILGVYLQEFITLSHRMMCHF